MYLGNVVQTELQKHKRFDLLVAEYIIRDQEIQPPSFDSSDIEVNTVVRIGEIFEGNLLSQEDPKFADLLLHFIGYLDITQKTKADLIQKMITDRLIELGYSKDIFTDSELEHIIANYQRMKATHFQLRYFTHSLFAIFKSPSLFFDEENDKYVLTTRVSYCDVINNKLRLIIDLFFDFAKDITIYWGDIAIIDSKYSPIIDKTLIYDEE